MIEEHGESVQDVEIGSGRSVLHRALSYGHTEVTRLLLAAGADPFMEDDYERPAIQLAARSLAGAELNVLDNGGYTLLLLACRINALQCARVLLEAGADVNLHNYHGHYPIHEATLIDEAALLTLLLSYRADMNARRPPLMCGVLGFAAEHENASAVAFSLSHGAKINSQDITRDTALHLALRLNACDSLEVLLRGGADCTKVNKNGFTVLHESVFNLECKIADNMARANLTGVDADARDAKGRTAYDLLDRSGDMPYEFRISFAKLWEAVRIANICQDTGVERDSDSEYVDLRSRLNKYGMTLA
ncbi:hypothetical protein MMC25_006135 [Agyrium rufum]|nr:hypothetical protein [Agyrium rufum]